jgi:hypothetical protein
LQAGAGPRRAQGTLLTAATERLSEIIRFAFAVVAWGLTALLIGLNTTLWLDMLWPRTPEEPSYAFRP